MVRRKHFAPVFANQRWADETGHYTKFHRYRRPNSEGAGSVQQDPAGREQWGRQKSGLWSLDVELALRDEVDGPTARIYERILQGWEPQGAERTKWAQFLLSQLVRTPTFIRYERWACAKTGIATTPDHDRVGCIHCGDLSYITGRDWALLVAHKDDFFVRTDNPVHQTSFLVRPQSALFYPLSRRLCFVACPMPRTWSRLPKREDPLYCLRLPKGAAHLVNFVFAKHADSSLIMHPKDVNRVATTMFTQMLGAYPQPPFSLHEDGRSDLRRSYASIRRIQSYCDEVAYPRWNPSDAEGAAARVAKRVRRALAKRR